MVELTFGSKSDKYSKTNKMDLVSMHDPDFEMPVSVIAARRCKEWAVYQNTIDFNLLNELRDRSNFKYYWVI